MLCWWFLHCIWLMFELENKKKQKKMKHHMMGTLQLATTTAFSKEENILKSNSSVVHL